MADPTSMHPEDLVLREFHLGKLGDALRDSVNAHLQGCPRCQARVADMASDRFPGRLHDATGSLETSPPAWSAGATAGPISGETSRPEVRAGTLPPDLADHPDYQVLRELGRGGMGVVYLAHNRLLGRDEVLKVVGRHLIERKGVLDRFTREIRSAARLTHPNIVHAYAAFRCGESIVFAMEYVEGLDLAKLVRSKGPLSVPHASYFAYQAALGLQHAHEQGMVHRDIKPSNLILSRRGDKAIVKVLDFGLAKATRENPVDGGLTHEGQMLGTPDFIAPEQIRDAQKAGIRADIYSLGCTLYYLLTGGPPFEGPSLYDLLQAHFSMEAQPLNLIRPEVPVELAALVGKMMAKDASRRFETPAEVAEALKPFFKKGGATSSPEVSVGGPPDLGARELESGSAPTFADPMRARETSGPATIEEPTTSQPRPSGEGEPAAPVSGRRAPRWARPTAAAAVLLLGLVAAWATSILRVRTPGGVIVLEEAPEDSEIVVDGERVSIRWPGGGSPIEIAVPAGKHVLLVKKDGFQTLGDQVAVEAGGRAMLRARLSPLGGAVSPPTPAGSTPGTETPSTPRARVSEASPSQPARSIIGRWSVKSVKIDDKDALAPELTGELRIGAIYKFLEGGGCLIEGASHEGSFDEVAADFKMRKHYPPENGKDRWWEDVHYDVRFVDEDLLLMYRDRNGKKVELRLAADGRPGGSTDVAAVPSGARSLVGRWTVKAVKVDDRDAAPAELTGRSKIGSVYKFLKDGSCQINGVVFETRFNEAEMDLCIPANRGDPELHYDVRFLGQDLMLTYGFHHSSKIELRLARDDAPVAPNAVAAERPDVPIPAETLTRNDGEHPAHRTVTNSIGMNLALIPAGEFLMGSPDSDLYAEDTEKPRHRVIITRPFYMGIHEVTRGQYKKVTDEDPGLFGGDDCPVNRICWKDAVEFCNRLSEREGLKPYYRFGAGEKWGGEGYRLPTEEEWEYACRAGSGSRYHFGEQWQRLGEFAWYASHSDAKAHPVGQRRANDFGLYDMHGNVAEFCETPYVADAYTKFAGGVPPDLSLASDRVLRGGSYKDEPRYCRSAYRYKVSSNANDFYGGGYGFRVARDSAAGPTGGVRAGSAERPAAPAPVSTRVAPTAGTGASVPAKTPPGPAVADASPEGRLKARGLTRSGSYFVVASEAEALAKFQAVRPVIDQLVRAFNEYAGVLRNESLLAEAEEYRANLNAQVDAAGSVLSKMPNGSRANSLQNQEYQAAQASRDGLVRERDASAEVVDNLRGQQAPAGRKEELAKDFAAKRADFLKAAGELRPLVETVTAEYRKLQGDPSVRDALAEYRKATKATVFLGPSKEFQRVVEMIKEADRAPESVAEKRKRKPASKAPVSRSPSAGSGRRK